MSKPLVINRTAACGACGIVGLALLACQARADDSYDPGWTKNFRLGALTGLGIKGQIKLRGSLAVSGKSPGPLGVHGANHEFDDGYVRVDDTGNALGQTSNWGYNNASQSDGAGTLSMHSANSVNATGSQDLDSQFSVGAELAYGQTLKQWERTRLGWEFGFGYLPITLESGGSPIAGTVNRTTYTFSTGSIVVPGAPYNGGASGIGPTISDVATLGNTTNVNATISDLGTLDADLFTFRLGPTFFYDLSSRVGLSASVGPAVGLLSEEFSFNSVLHYDDGTAPGHVKGRFSQTDIVYGGYISVMGTFHVEANGDVYLGVQYMPMSTSTFSKGGRQASVDLSGQIYISLGVNWIF